MTWYFEKANLFSDSSGRLSSLFNRTVKGMELLGTTLNAGSITQIDAQSCDIPSGAVISTDPPYYDNIGYADLSDFFYILLRPMLSSIYPDLFGTIGVPKEIGRASCRERVGQYV